MRVRPTALNNPAALAHTVRELASEAHRILKDPSAHTSEIRDLAGRISDLQRQVRGHADDDLTRWLENARLRIEAA